MLLDGPLVLRCQDKERESRVSRIYKNTIKQIGDGYARNDGNARQWLRKYGGVSVVMLFKERC